MIRFELSESLLVFYATLAPHPRTWRAKIKDFDKKYKGATFFVTQNFFIYDLLRFWSLGDPRGRGLGWWGHVYIKNTMRGGAEVSTKFGPAVHV